MRNGSGLRLLFKEDIPTPYYENLLIRLSLVFSSESNLDLDLWQRKSKVVLRGIRVKLRGFDSR